MEFYFNVNEVLKNPIEIIDSSTKLGYLPYGFGDNQQNSIQIDQKLSYIVNEMGKASSLAQSIPQPITSCSRLRFADDQKLYILKDPDGNGGRGSVVGILKMGLKTLFLYDFQNRHLEMRPLCVLDFYVHESRQRLGHGRRIFDFMLANEGVLPHHLAIDRPSPKFLSFLAKHFGLTDDIPQVNNYVIFTNFFRDRNDAQNGQPHRRPPLSLTPIVRKSSATLSKGSSRIRTQSASNSASHPHAMPSNVPSCNPPNNTADSNGTPLDADHRCSPKVAIVPHGFPEAPPLLQRDVSADHVRWYLAANPHSSASRRRTVVPDIGPTLTTAPFTVEKSSLACRSSPSLAKPPILLPPPSAGATRQHRVRHHDRVEPISAIPIRLDYNYSLGLARHYSHTRLW